jgi:hypothetical protein
MSFEVELKKASGQWAADFDVASKDPIVTLRRSCFEAGARWAKEYAKTKQERFVQAARDEGYVEGWNKASEELELRKALEGGE